MDWKVIIGSMIGASLGYLYYRKVGCASGTCPLTSSAGGSTIYGALIGYLLASSF